MMTTTVYTSRLITRLHHTVGLSVLECELTKNKCITNLLKHRTAFVRLLFLVNVRFLLRFFCVARLYFRAISIR
ncbi:hypothetical protein Hanom_Chr02g00145371 [Helianthus anomalus]